VVEGRSREAIWRDGIWWDELHMSVLEPEWRAARWQATAVAEGRTEGVAGRAAGRAAGVGDVAGVGGAEGGGPVGPRGGG
jgi:hypothetical protein